MKKYIILIFLTFLNFQTVYADDLFCCSIHLQRGYITGEIQEIRRNSLKIIDEKDKLIKRFIFLEDTENLRKGDRVRAHYENGNIIESINKLTDIEYKKNGQNAGYIFKQE